MVCADGQQPGELTLRTGIGLQRDGVVAGDLAQRRLKVVNHSGVATGLVGGGEWVHLRELRPRDRCHLGGRVQLHGARTQRDHGAVERQVLVGQAAQVAHHVVLFAVLLEDGVVEDGILAAECGGNALGRRRVQRLHRGGHAEGAPHGLHHVARGGLVE